MVVFAPRAASAGLVLSVARPIALALDGDDVGVMDDAIDAGGDTFRLASEPSFAPGECYAPPAVAGRTSWMTGALNL